MRKTLETISVVIWAALIWITHQALAGPIGHLAQIPTHFDAHGQPNGWSRPETLWLLPAIASAVFLLLTITANLRTRCYSSPVPVTEANLPFIRRETAVLQGWIKAEMMLLFFVIQGSMIDAAMARENRFSPGWIFAIVAVLLITAGWRTRVMIKGAKARLEPGASVTPQ